MTMQHLENEFRKTGDPYKQALADVIASIHESLGSDIPLPSVATPEKQLEIQRSSVARNIGSMPHLVVPPKETPKP